MLRVSRMRSTAFSPATIGSVETRRSSLRPCTIARMRPSWGTRRSAMSRFAMILMRLRIAAFIDAGGDSVS